MVQKSRTLFEDILRALLRTIWEGVKIATGRFTPLRWVIDRLGINWSAVVPVPPDFDWREYVQMHPDLHEIRTEFEATNHYLAFGIREKRCYKQTSPFPEVEIARVTRVANRLHDGLCVTGHLCSEIGLGQAARNISYALDCQRIPLHFKNIALPDRENDHEFKTKVTMSSGCRGNLILLGIPSLDAIQHMLEPGRCNIFFPFWELGRIPERWLDKIRQFDEVWAPSRFIAGAFPPGFDIPVRIIGLPVRCPSWGLGAGCASPATNTPLRMLTFFDFDSYVARKNPKAAVMAFQAAFPPSNHDVRLTIKARGVYDHEFCKWLHSAVKHDPRIEMINKTMSREEMDQMMHDCDVFISLHRSEGFGFGAAEALAAGKVVVSTDYSGTCDFITPETGYPVAYKLIPVRRGEYPGWKGQVWADSCLESAVEALRSIYNDRTLAQAKADRGRALIAGHFSLDIIGRRMVSSLRELHIIQ